MKASVPLVSVIIPNRDRTVELGRAVDSVLAQVDVDLELIVVDDASPSPPNVVYESVRKSGHQVLFQPSRKGPGPARNRAAQVAKGRYLALLDSDDSWLPNKLNIQLAQLESSGLRCGQVDEIWYRDGTRVNPPKAHRITGGDLFLRSLRAVCVSSSSVVLERDLFWEAGGFDEELFVCEDYDLWCRVAADHVFDFCDQHLVVKYGGHADQLSKAMPAMDRFRILALVKAVDGGEFGTKEDLATTELQRKIGILRKGSAKHGRVEAATLCDRLQVAVEQKDRVKALEVARALLHQWPTEPGD